MFLDNLPGIFNASLPGIFCITFSTFNCSTSFPKTIQIGLKSISHTFQLKFLPIFQVHLSIFMDPFSSIYHLLLPLPCHCNAVSVIPLESFKRVRTRVVVVVVRELLFLVTSVICVRIRGRGSEVTTTPYHIRLDFRLKQRPCHNGFVVLFLRYLLRKHKTYRYSV